MGHIPLSEHSSLLHIIICFLASLLSLDTRHTPISDFEIKCIIKMITTTTTTMSNHTQLRTGARPMMKDSRDEDARPSSYTPCCPNLTTSRGCTKEILGHRLMAKSIGSQGRTEEMHLTVKHSIKPQHARPDSGKRLRLIFVALSILLGVA